MNIRMQVTLPEEHHARVAEKAAARGVSLAEYLRRLVSRDLEDEAPLPAPAITALFGIGDSGGGDVGTHKQAYLADAVAADKADSLPRS